MTQHNSWSDLLSPRERTVAGLVVRGLSNKEIARQLGLSEGTVKIYLHGIFRKVGLKGRAGLILLATSHRAGE